MYVVSIIAVLVFSVNLFAQNGTGPEIPIILEHADSAVAIGQFESAVRTFYGTVRFRQGNVTGRCDRAIHNADANTIELFGNVVIKQDGLTMVAPEIRYSGVRHLAVAPRGVSVEQRGQVITAKKGEYSTITKIVSFFNSVSMRDDTTTLEADTVILDRSADTTLAMGSVILYDSTNRSWFEADVARRNNAEKRFSLVGNARLWTWSEHRDTLLVTADTINAWKDGLTLAYVIDAFGHSTVVRNTTSARAGSLRYHDGTGEIRLREHPCVWTDSTQFTAVEIDGNAPRRKMESMQGRGSAMLASLVGGASPARYNQIAATTVDLTFTGDTLRNLLASGQAQSITFRGEKEQEGLAKVASDSIRATFEQGELADVFWLGGIAGEHHPEKVVFGHEADYILPGLVWRTDRPRMLRPRSFLSRKLNSGAK